MGRMVARFEGAPIPLINHKGVRTGKIRTNPVMYFKDGDRYLVFASEGGSPTNPDWYHNLKAHPDVKIEVGGETIDVRAEELKGAEREGPYTKQSALYPQLPSISSQQRELFQS